MAEKKSFWPLLLQSNFLCIHLKNIFDENKIRYAYAVFYGKYFYINIDLNVKNI